MKVFNNITDILRDDMTSTIKKGSKVSIAAACFSMYAYNELKNSWKILMSFDLYLHTLHLLQKRLKSKNANSIFRVLIVNIVCMGLNLS